MKKIFICLTIVCLFINCKDEKKKKMDSKLNIVSYKELLEDWKVFTNDSIKANIPSIWLPQREEGVLLYVPLKKNKANLYFAILKTDTSIVDIKNYLKEVFRQMSLKDKKFTYQITKIDFENGTNCYSGVFYSKENGVNCKAYCLIYQKKNMIYDFSYKCLNDVETNIDNYRLFFNVLFSFTYKDDIIIDSENFKVKNDEEIKYEDL